MREVRLDVPRAAPSGHAAATPEKIFSIRADQRPRAGLVQPTVQIVASHDLTLVVRRRLAGRASSLAFV